MSGWVRCNGTHPRAAAWSPAWKRVCAPIRAISSCSLRWKVRRLVDEADLVPGGAHDLLGALGDLRAAVDDFDQVGRELGVGQVPVAFGQAQCVQPGAAELGLRLQQHVRRHVRRVDREVVPVARDQAAGREGGESSPDLVVAEAQRVAQLVGGRRGAVDQHLVDRLCRPAEPGDRQFTVHRAKSARPVREKASFSYRSARPRSRGRLPDWIAHAADPHDWAAFPTCGGRHRAERPGSCRGDGAQTGQVGTNRPVDGRIRGTGHGGGGPGMLCPRVRLVQTNATTVQLCVDFCLKLPE